MNDFTSYKEYIRKFVKELGGFDTKFKKPYRAIDFSTNSSLSFGTSVYTAKKHPSIPCGCTNSGDYYTNNDYNHYEDYEYDRSKEYMACSHQIAAADLEALKVYKHNITQAAYD